MRIRLPNRRLNATDAIAALGRMWLLGVGFDREGRAREVFAQGVKTGSELELLIDDACVLASLLLQHDYTPTFLAERLGGPPGLAAGRPAAIEGASLIAQLLTHAAETEAEAGAGIREAYSASERFNKGGPPHRVVP